MALAPGAEASPVRPTGRPIALYLTVLAVVALVPAFVFSAILLQRHNEAQQRVVTALTTATTQAIASAVNRQVDGIVTTLRVLSTSPPLVEGDIPEFYENATAALGGSGAYVFVLDGELEMLMHTLVPLGADLPTLSDPSGPARAIETDAVVVSDVLFGRLANDWVFSVSMPVPEATHGSARVLAMVQNARSLGVALTSRELPDAWNVAVVDSHDHVLASSIGARLDPGTAFPMPLDRSNAQQGQWQTIPVGATRQTAAYWNVGSTGWIVVAWADEADVERPFAETFWSLVLGGVMLAAVVAIIIYRVSLQIGRSVRRLAEEARLLGAGETVPPRSYPISEIATVSNSISEASRKRQAAEVEVRLLMRELAHRSKNQLTVIAAMAKQSAKGVDSVPVFVNGFERRIHGLARSTDLLLAHGIAGVGLRDVIARQIEPLSPLDAGRVRYEGPALTLNTQSAQILGMAAHEMATNALKHGAFASDRGTLDVTWRVEGDNLHLTWRERGAAAPPATGRRGFGTTVIETMVSRSLGATVTRTLHPDGIAWDFVIPADSIDLHAMPPDAFGDHPGPDQPAIDQPGAERPGEEK